MIYEHRSVREKEALTLCYGGWDKDLKPGQTYGPVIRDTYIIECCTGGFGSVIINGREFPVKSGDCYFLLPGDTVIHTADILQPRTGVFCSVDGLAIKGYLSLAGITSAMPFAPKEVFEEITGLVQRLVETKDAEDAGAKLRQSACLYGIFGALLRSHGAGKERSDPIEKALRIMDTCYPEPLSVSGIAEEVGLERCYFSTLFRQQTGFAPHQYLTRLRIRKACALMEHRGCSVSVAAASVGIPAENFARLFRKWTGETPSRFRQNLKLTSDRK